MQTYKYTERLEKCFSDKGAAYWRYYDGEKWRDGLGGYAPPLYVAGSLEGNNIFVASDEKDAEALHAMGFDACCPAKRGEWKESYNRSLEGKSIFFLPCNTNKDKGFCSKVAKTVPGAAVKALNPSAIWPAVPEGGGVADMVYNRGEDRVSEGIAEAIESAPVIPLKGTWAVRRADSFGEINISFLWKPYFPKGEYTVLMADGGTGKTIFCCGVAAALSRGIIPLTSELTDPVNTLFISAEDTGEILRSRLAACNADFKHIYIIDCIDSCNKHFVNDWEAFTGTIKQNNIKLVIIDPWHAFTGEELDINKVNAVRPVFQKMANVAKDTDSSIVLISHVNKRSQGDNANFAATGSTDFINASRSAIRIVFDEQNEDCRVAVHTKSNYAAAGKSLLYRITDQGGVEWVGYSDITRKDLERAARSRMTPREFKAKEGAQEKHNEALKAAIRGLVCDGKVVNVSYDEMRERFGEDIFGLMQPKKALEQIAFDLRIDGIEISFKSAGVLYNGRARNGLAIMKCNELEQGTVLNLNDFMKDK